MMFKQALAPVLLCGLAIAAPRKTRSVSFNWDYTKVRGVNLGGWLVLEPWITPSLFDGLDDVSIVDEFTLCERLGQDEALNVLREHWDSWVTWYDFQKISDSGFNLVRLPIGYWAYDTFDTPYVSGAAVYVDAAIDWARGLGLKIIIDLHGAPGSQNGFDNSGQRLTDGPGWQSDQTVSQTLQVLETIADKYAQIWYQDVIVGIELLNEPLSTHPNIDRGILEQFYRDGLSKVRAVSDTPIIFHDGFQSPSSWNGFLDPTDEDAQFIVVDHHEYQVFDNGLLDKTPLQHKQQVCASADTYNGADKWTIVGEWSGAMTDCAKYLNGFNVGARYDGLYPDSSRHGECGWQDNLDNWDPDFRDATRAYIEAQMDTYEANTRGWIWWNFKTEGAHEWDAFALIDAGVFPQPLTDRTQQPC